MSVVLRRTVLGSVDWALKNLSDDFCSGCQNYRQKCIPGLHSPRQSDYTITCYPLVQTIYCRKLKGKSDQTLWGNPVMGQLPILEETEIHVTIKSLCAMQTQRSYSVWQRSPLVSRADFININRNKYLGKTQVTFSDEEFYHDCYSITHHYWHQSFSGLRWD